MKKLYIVTFENSEGSIDVAWFVAPEGMQHRGAVETIREWEALEDTDSVTIGQIYEVDQELIDQVGKEE